MKKLLKYLLLDSGHPLIFVFNTRPNIVHVFGYFYVFFVDYFLLLAALSSITGLKDTVRCLSFEAPI